jgi:hypothetical protein
VRTRCRAVDRELEVCAGRVGVVGGEPLVVAGRAGLVVDDVERAVLADVDAVGLAPEAEDPRVGQLDRHCVE